MHEAIDMQCHNTIACVQSICGDYSNTPDKGKQLEQVRLTKKGPYAYCYLLITYKPVNICEHCKVSIAVILTATNFYL